MGAPQLTQCCCGCTLEKGSLIIGWLGIVGGILGLLSAVAVTSSGHGSPGFDITNAIFSLIFLPISIMLIIGIKRPEQKYVRIWVLVSTVILVVDFVLILIDSGIVMTIDILDGFALLITCIISSLISAYLILVVHSYYREKFFVNSNV